MIIIILVGDKLLPLSSCAQVLDYLQTHQFDTVILPPDRHIHIHDAYPENDNLRIFSDSLETDLKLFNGVTFSHPGPNGGLFVSFYSGENRKLFSKKLSVNANKITI
ncbi:hypothetical protein, partial [Piscirickettsia litoralis]|uniref:hypothetical protein n=1 Tax=Piscirickettsia litoralis TaxID=1891921 RepID=UPI001F42FEB3